MPNRRDDGGAMDASRNAPLPGDATRLVSRSQGLTPPFPLLILVQHPHDCCHLISLFSCGPDYLHLQGHPLRLVYRMRAYLGAVQLTPHLASPTERNLQRTQKTMMIMTMYVYLLKCFTLPEQLQELPTRDAKAEAAPEMDNTTRLQQLESLLQKSRAYSTIMKDRMEQARLNMRKSDGIPANIKPKSSSKGKKRALEDETIVTEEPPIEQPALITGATLKTYQLEGLAWMASLYENGISGILADEMGLGKVRTSGPSFQARLTSTQTLQTIAFSAFYRERSFKPFLVVCPLSVLHNWADELQKFAPDVSTLLRH
jgi:hypothetical protein